MNMNKQPGLYNNDYRPLTRSLPSQRAWTRTSFPASHLSSPAPNGGPPDFQLTFRHRFAHDGEDVYFAFCYPHSYDECQDLQRSAARAHLVDGGGGSMVPPHMHASVPPPPPRPSGGDDIYLCRELLTRSLGGRRIDLQQ